MAFLIHKGLWNLSYARHNSLTLYALRRTKSNFWASNFHDCICKVMVVTKKGHLCIVASPSSHFIAYYHNIISSWINGRLTCLITSIWTRFRRFPSKERWFYVTQAKSRSRTLRCIWCKYKWQKRNVTSRLVFTYHCSETDGLRCTLHFLKVILWTYFDI